LRTASPSDGDGTVTVWAYDNELAGPVQDDAGKPMVGCLNTISGSAVLNQLCK
jgi:hypothetical protein